MNKENFQKACEKIMGEERVRTSIGTYSEKTLHAVLKNYFEPRESCHEIKLGGFIADIFTEDGIIEIQTRGLARLCKKLDFFLQEHKVTVVLPIPHIKYISWIDGETGEVTKKHKSPKLGKAFHGLFEIYGIRQYLDHPNFTLCIVMIDTTDYRNLNGWSKNKKRGSTRYDTIPDKIVEEIYLTSKEDCLNLIDFTLPEEFTANDFKKASKLSPRHTYSGINLFCYLGLAEKIGKKGRANTFKLLKTSNHEPVDL